VIGDAGGCLQVCGEVIKNTTVSSADSALEAMCVSPWGAQRLQLARQLTALALNCVVSHIGPSCSIPNLADLFSRCNALCVANSDKEAIGDCIDAIDCFNNGNGGIDANGDCKYNAPNRCKHVDFNDGPSADTPKQCKQARESECKIVPPGETKCKQPGNESSGPETCN